MSTFGARLRTARKTAGLTLEQLAQRSGCTKSLLAQYENGRVAECRMVLLFSIADTLKTSPRWLATGKGTQYHTGTLSDMERDIILILRELPPPVREHIVRLAESMAMNGLEKASHISPFPAARRPK